LAHSNLCEAPLRRFPYLAPLSVGFLGMLAGGHFVNHDALLNYGVGNRLAKSKEVRLSEMRLDRSAILPFLVEQKTVLVVSIFMQRVEQAAGLGSCSSDNDFTRLQEGGAVFGANAHTSNDGMHARSLDLRRAAIDARAS